MCEKDEQVFFWAAKAFAVGGLGQTFYYFALFILLFIIVLVAKCDVTVTHLCCYMGGSVVLVLPWGHVGRGFSM